MTFWYATLYWNLTPQSSEEKKNAERFFRILVPVLLHDITSQQTVTLILGQSNGEDLVKQKMQIAWLKASLYFSSQSRETR
jgi:hypothetical protein